MKIAFYIAAAAMIAVALAVLLLPLMRHGRTSTRPRAVFALALVIALVLPLGTASLYLMVGTPVALNTIQAQAPVSMEQALVQLRTHLTEQPDLVSDTGAPGADSGVHDVLRVIAPDLDTTPVVAAITAAADRIRAARETAERTRTDEGVHA